MKPNNPTDISLLTFFKTGHFNYIEPGQSKQWILSHFPNPDDISNQEHGFSIWRYGNIEFHFEHDTLYLIFSDYIHALDGGPSLRLDPWFLHPQETKTLPAICSALYREKIDYNLRHHPRLPEALSLQLFPSHITLHFEKSDDAPDEIGQCILSAFSVQKK